MDSTEFCVASPEAPQMCKQLKCYNMLQGAKKVIFTACHSGKLKLTFTSPNVISTSPKNVLMSRLISQFFCNLYSSKNFTCPSGKLITEFPSPIAKSSSPGLSDTTLFARCARTDADQTPSKTCQNAANKTTAPCC